MAGSFGYKFIYFSAVFYLFLGFVLYMGAGSWLVGASITTNNTFSAGTYNYTAIAGTDTTTWDIVTLIFQNPFSGIAFLAWLSVAILITDVYIVVTSVIP